jgi:hypothetical protein
LTGFAAVYFGDRSPDVADAASLLTNSESGSGSRSDEGDDDSDLPVDRRPQSTKVPTAAGGGLCGMICGRRGVATSWYHALSSTQPHQPAKRIAKRTTT